MIICSVREVNFAFSSMLKAVASTAGDHVNSSLSSTSSAVLPLTALKEKIAYKRH
jgi:hypothetical protein